MQVRGDEGFVFSEAVDDEAAENRFCGKQLPSSVFNANASCLASLAATDENCRYVDKVRTCVQPEHYLR